jgi:hypothetical protein
MHIHTMIRIIRFSGIFLFCLYAWSQNAGSGVKNDITLHTFVESDNVPLNREVVYNIELQWTGDLSLYKINDISEPQVTNLIMRGSGSSNRVSTDEAGNPVSIKRVTYYFRPVEMGMAYVEGVTIKYEDTSSQRQESLLSSRIGIKIIDPLPEPGKNGLGFITWLALVVFIVFLALLYFYYRSQKRKQAQAYQAAWQQQETIEERYQRVLKETIHFTTSNLKDSLVDLSRLITGYFSERYNFPAMNLSTENLLQVLREKLSDDTFIRLQDFYHRSDMIKFAGEPLSESEFHRLIDIVELVLEKQKEFFAEKEEK